jgi:hypothetical protein
MTEARARAICDRHIRELSPAERLQLLALLAADLSTQAESVEERPLPDVLALYGSGKDRGIGVDAQEYIDRLRDGQSIRANED